MNLCPLFPLRPVTGAGDQLEPAAGDLVGHLQAGAGRAGRVVAGPHDQRRPGDGGEFGVGDEVAPADVGVLQAQDVPHGVGEPGPGVDGAPDGDEFVGDGARVGHQPFQAGPDALVGGVVGGGLGQAADLLHHLGAGHGPAGGVEDEIADPVGVGGGELDRDPAAEGFAVEVGALDAECVEEVGEVVEVGVEFEVGLGVGGVAVAGVVVGDHVVVLGERGDVVGVGLQVARRCRAYRTRASPCPASRTRVRQPPTSTYRTRCSVAPIATQTGVSGVDSPLMRRP